METIMVISLFGTAMIWGILRFVNHLIHSNQCDSEGCVSWCFYTGVSYFIAGFLSFLVIMGFFGMAFYGIESP